MSRTFRVNKYGDIKTDKNKKKLYGCGCGYCEFINTDFRNKYKEIIADKKVYEELNYTDDLTDDLSDYYDEMYYLDTTSHYIMIKNNENITMKFLK